MGSWVSLVYFGPWVPVTAVQIRASPSCFATNGRAEQTESRSGFELRETSKVSLAIESKSARVWWCVTDDLPPGVRCTHDGCECEGVDPDYPAPLCSDRAPGGDDGPVDGEADDSESEGGGSSLAPASVR